VPRQFRYQIVKQTHEQTHYGFLKNYLTARQKFFWFGMVEDFQLFAESCTVCQQIKPSKTEKFKMTSMPVYNFLDAIFIDYHEIRLPKRDRTPEAYKYVLGIVESFTQNIILVPARDTSAETSAKLIYEHYVLRFGAFKYLISDRGTSWVNQLFTAFLNLPALKAMHIKTTPYRAKMNSTIENKWKNVIRHLRAYCDQITNFPDYLNTIACTHNATVSQASGLSPFFLLHGENYRWPIDLEMMNVQQTIREPNLQFLAERMRIMREIVKENWKDTREANERIKNKGLREPPIIEGDRVFIPQHFVKGSIQNAKHQKLWHGPYAVVAKKSNLLRLQHIYTGKLFKKLD
jgi:hypothetical protein